MCAEKTLAFLLPVLQKILIKKSQDIINNNTGASHIRAIILVPTKELCSQINKVLQNLIYYCDDMITGALLSATSHGRGKNAREELTRQEATLRDRPDIIVATPTGLAAHIQNGSVADLKSSVETLVIDEADLVLSFGHEKALHEIVKALPKIYQGFLMSATLSPEIDAIKKVVLHSPVILKLEEDENEDLNRRLKQFYLCLPKKDKGLVVYVFLKVSIILVLFVVSATCSQAFCVIFMLELSPNKQTAWSAQRQRPFLCQYD